MLSDQLPNSQSQHMYVNQQRKSLFEKCREEMVNPLTPRSDWEVTSPYNIHTSSSKQLMGILKLIM